MSPPPFPAHPSVPVKFTIDGATVANIFDAGFPQTQPIDCVSRGAVPGITPAAADGAWVIQDPVSGEYHYNCPLDQRFLSFAGIDPKKLLAELKKGKGDGEILEWIQTNVKHKRSPWEIQQWSDYMDLRGPDSDAETLVFFAEYVARFTKTREDIKTWADVLELDDFVSFGGKA